MPVTLSTLKALRQKGEKIAVLTCYDASFARVFDAAGVDVLLVGDSLGMVIQGHASTLPVKLAEMAYHTRCVAAGTTRAFIVADLPFGSYQPSPERAYTAAARLMAAGAHMIKLEGGAVMVDTVAFLAARGIPVCAHLGLLPQSVNQLGGYRVQGREDGDAAQLVADARALEAAGAGLIVLEMVPAALAKTVTAALSMPTIGIGAGADCAGQVLVSYDMLGLYPRAPKFSKNFLAGAGSVDAAVRAYVAAVKDGSFPAAEHAF
ncbi:ketopantoate hydroxymethyltransferase [Thiobacillus denitrificans ATCC 25259]|uniref:3-methyl-2-oxobutanoate hydroxymethyltransferase n=1 Tax=Thiobacillus denitrificans (strain ATCC 25259 / T1) TaxID=292415 RepID=PANB_THIDA|nr:3-methyl-2-oxobutanoate hydroxymethyltransferase [Thiobacillus denitrificans]Q3SH83.1 RecName: Full=3-methyl-2-oxobutanoate hydroxymethyltransferase; AltName: Full=Ketopantoate hydroxymethyltransferase; Short=KPHMT [Thiobacillus denitrificans ATCC 25259]AAZ98006.1 ketopantoate hydroxymethyltransferase [Thiobacillus denitrificans ATCC 25259]